MSAPQNVFDRSALALRKARFARAADDGAAFLFEETADRLIDRLMDVSRTFDVALDLTGHGGLMTPRLKDLSTVGAVISSDIVPDLARRAAAHGPALVCDEAVLPFGSHTLDLVASNLALHWVNDLPGALAQLRRALKPDGLLLAGVLGGDTLKELRGCLADAEIELEGGLSPRVSPFIDVRDMGALLQRAGFALPVVDADAITVTYADPFALMGDLRAMGETNAVRERRKGLTRRATLMRAAELYMERYAGEDAAAPRGRVPATFQVIWLAAWAPAANQPRPLKPGAAALRLSDALGAKETTLDDGEGTG